MLGVSIVTPVFTALTDRPTLGGALQGLIDGVIVTLLVGGYLLFVRDDWARAWYRRLGFAADLALSSAIVLVLFLVGRALGQLATTLDPRRALASFGDAHLAYALPFFVLLAVAVQVGLQMNRMIGANILGYFAARTIGRRRKSGSSCFSISKDRRSSRSGSEVGATSSCSGASSTI